MRARSTTKWRALLAVVWSPALASALFLAGGGIWERVGIELHGIYVHKYEYAGRALRELRLPLWNRDEFCGIPLLGVGQGAMLYPPVAILFAWLTPRTALQALYVAHIVLLGAASAIYLRRHRIGWFAAGVPALLAPALIFTGRGALGFDHPAFLMSIAWLPVMLVCCENALDGAFGRWTALLGIAAGAQWLAGYPDFPLDTAVLLMAVAVVRGGGSLTRRVAIVVVGVGLGAALAAVQILPLAETVRESIRVKFTAGYAEGRDVVFGVHALADLTRGALRTAFLPAAALAVLALVRPRPARLAWLLALLWCVFPLNLPFSLLYRVPPFSSVRYPLGWEYSAPVFLSFLAAAAFDTALCTRRRWLSLPAIALAGVVAVHAGFTVWRTPSVGEPLAPDYHLLAERAATLRALMHRPDLSGGRLLAVPEIQGGSLLRDELPSPTGFEPSVPPYRVVELLTKKLGVQVQVQLGDRWRGVANNPDLAALLGIGWLATSAPSNPGLGPAGFVDVGRLPPNDVVMYRRPIPRARLVHRITVVDGEEQSLEHVSAHAADAWTSAVLESGVDVPTLSAPPEGSVESSTIVVDEPERLAVDVVAASPALLVVTDTFFPGWYAQVDATPVPIVRADHAFRAIAVAPGSHHVELRYAPSSVRRGLIVSIVAGVAVVALVVFGGSRRRSRPRRDDDWADATT